MSRSHTTSPLLLDHEQSRLTLRVTCHMRSAYLRQAMYVSVQPGNGPPGSGILHLRSGIRSRPWSPVFSAGISSGLSEASAGQLSTSPQWQPTTTSVPESSNVRDGELDSRPGFLSQPPVLSRYAHLGSTILRRMPSPALSLMAKSAISRRLSAENNEAHHIHHAGSSFRGRPAIGESVGDQSVRPPVQLGLGLAHGVLARLSVRRASDRGGHGDSAHVSESVRTGNETMPPANPSISVVRRPACGRCASRPWRPPPVRGPGSCVHRRPGPLPSDPDTSMVRWGHSWPGLGRRVEGPLEGFVQRVDNLRYRRPGVAPPNALATSVC